MSPIEGTRKPSGPDPGDAADRAVRAWFTVDPAPTPPSGAGFVDRVMARVAVTPQDRPATATAPAIAAFALLARGDAFPWWVRAAVQPASVLALVLASAAAFFAPQLARISVDAPQWSAAALAVVSGTIMPWLVRVDTLAGADLVAGTGMALALLVLVGLASIALFRFGTSLATARATMSVRRGRSVPGA